MKFNIALALLSATAVSAFSPGIQSSAKLIPRAMELKSSVSADSDESMTSMEVEYKPILRDPLGLYPKNAPEREEGRILPLEPSVDSFQDKTVRDPLNLYAKLSSKQEVTRDPEVSMSLPFAKRPEMLDGSLPGDRGFDPFNFSSNSDALQWYRTAEVKHARIAMLAAAGWPLAELFDRKIAYALDLKPLLVFQDRVPSVLNGGLTRISPAYWIAVLGIATAIEAFGFAKESKATEAGKEYTPGDLGFDPLGLFGKTDEERKFMLEAELFNGRLGMLAITGFAIQEWWTQNSVINEFPIFFKPINVALEQLADAAGNMT